MSDDLRALPPGGETGAPPPPSSPPRVPSPTPAPPRTAGAAEAMFAVVFWLALLLIAVVLGLIKGPNMLVTVGGWLVLVALSLPFFVVSVPEVTGLVVLNLFTGGLKTFGPGLKLKFPWDVVREKNFFSLELVTRKFEETYASQDGPMMLVKASWQYNPDQRHLRSFIAVDETTIDKGFTDVLSSILSSIVSGKKAEDARKEIKPTETEVLRQFEEKSLKDGTLSIKEKLEAQYGINFRLFAIADIDYSADYQEARSARARMGKFAETVKHLKEQVDGISDKDAVNVTLLEQGKGTKKNIFEVEGLGDALGTLAGVLKGKKES